MLLKEEKVEVVVKEEKRDGGDKGEGELSKCGSFGWRFNPFYAEEHSCWCHLALSSASPMLSSLPQPKPLHAMLHPPKPAPLCIFTSWPDAWILLGVVRGMHVLGHHSDLVKMLAFFLPQYCAQHCAVS